MRESSIPILEGGSPNHLSTEEIEDNRYFLYVQFLMIPSRVVMLDLEADDSCEAKGKSCGERAVKLRLE